MPRFKVEASTDLIEPLKELGIKAALGGQRGQFLELSTSVDVRSWPFHLPQPVAAGTDPVLPAA